MSPNTTPTTDVAEKIRKLLKLAERAGTEHEAAAASAKVQELLETYNLDMATVERESGRTARREEQRLRGGAHRWQRDLWQAVAGLHFCLYFPTRARGREKVRQGRTIRRWEFHHCLVGRTVNVATATQTCQYLERTIERLTRERIRGAAADLEIDGGSWAMAFREGVADRVCQRLSERRRARLSEEREREMRERDAASAGASTATALSLLVYIDAETDANNDFLYGEGWSAAQAAARADRAAQRAAAERARAEWEAAHPEEAAAEAARQREEEKKWASKSRWRGGRTTDAERRRWSGAYAEGRSRGDDVGLDPQTSHETRRALL